MRVSLSASHANCDVAIELLKSCDVIYTTQYNRLDEIRELFTEARVLPIPDCCPDMLEFLKERHKDDDVITFGDLMDIRNKDLQQSIL